jgi:hypothetical protein
LGVSFKSEPNLCCIFEINGGGGGGYLGKSFTENSGSGGSRKCRSPGVMAAMQRERRRKKVNGEEERGDE